MRVLLAFAALTLLTSCYCKSDFKVGDCFQWERSSTAEAWDTPSVIYRVEEVGAERYRTSFYSNERWYCLSRSDACIDHFKTDRLTKVECPK